MNPLSRNIKIPLPLAKAGLKLPALLLLLIALLSAVITATLIGAFPIPALSLLQGDLTAQEQAVLSAIRLPRVLLAMIVGAALAVSGAALQGLFRNPLADPGLIGISSGAALAVALTIVSIGPLPGILGLYSLSIAAFIGGLLTSMVIFRFAGLTGASSVTYILLAGIAINALASAGTGFLAYLSDDQELRALTFWTMGSLGGALWPGVLICASLVIPATCMLYRNAQRLNILLLGESEARHLGVDSARLKRNIIICAAISVGAAVAVSGIIGFVGLVIPHLIRLTLGPDHRLLIPASALLGAIMLIMADTVSRTLLAPAEIPVGIFTSLIGGPFFLWLLVKQYSGRFGV